MEKTKESISKQNEYITHSNIKFNDNQNIILTVLDQQISAYDNCSDRLSIIQGKAGTGKSCVINEMVRRINSC